MELARGKLQSIVQHSIYEISTGKWPSGQKLPSVRKAEKLWGVNRLTVLGAYRELTKMGLVESKDRSGFFVSSNHDLSDSQNTQEILMALYDQVKRLIQSKTDLQTSYALKYLTDVAEKEARDNPELAFIECSQSQAQGEAIGDLFFGRPIFSLGSNICRQYRRWDLSW